MLVEIHNTGTDLLQVYEIHNRRMKSSETRPICSIFEDDFFDMLPEKEYDKATEQSKIHFEVNRTILLMKCKTLFKP